MLADLHLFDLLQYAPAEARGLVVGWFKEATEEKDIERLMNWLRPAIGPEQRAVLLGWVDDPRPFAATGALNGLWRYPDPEVIAAARAFRAASTRFGQLTSAGHRSPYRVIGRMPSRLPAVARRVEPKDVRPAPQSGV